MIFKTHELLEHARALGERLRAEDSQDLPAVRDSVTKTLVPCWRTQDGKTDHALHKMMSRVGGFPPSLARYLIACYSGDGDVIADPFCGKGTTLFEAVRSGRNAVGGDIAPDAVVVTRAKCSAVSVVSVANYVEGLRIARHPPMSDVPAAVRVFYSRRTLEQILSIRARLLEDMATPRTRRIATFVCGVILGLLHGHSRLSLSLPCNQAFAMSPNYVKRYAREHGLKRPDRDVRQCLLQRALELLPFPQMARPPVVREASAETCGRYIRSSVGEATLFLTSPPYLNRQTYLKDSWLRLWFLGKERSELAGKTLETGNVHTFVEGMKTALGEMAGSVSPRGRIVLVCGRAHIDVRGRKHTVRVADLVLHAKESAPYLERLILERVIRDRKLMKRGSYFAVHHGTTQDGNGRKHPRYGEDEILVFRKD